MLHINNNSVVCPLFASASVREINELQNYLYTNSINACFFGSVVRFAVTGVITIQIPQKCLKSLDLLTLWLVGRIDKELNKCRV